MEYTKGAWTVLGNREQMTKLDFAKQMKDAIKEDIHWAYGDWIEGNQLSEKDYAVSQEELAEGILEDTRTVQLYEALKGLLKPYAIPNDASFPDYPKYWVDAVKALAKAEGKE